MSSPKPSECFDLERDVPTTPEDVRVLRELRSRKPEGDWLARLQAAADVADLFPDAPRPCRRTFEGVEPFELDLTSRGHPEEGGRPLWGKTPQITLRRPR